MNMMYTNKHIQQEETLITPEEVNNDSIMQFLIEASMSYKKVVLKNFAFSCLCWSLFLIKLSS